MIGANAQGEPPTCGGSASVPAASAPFFTSEIDGIKSQAPLATVEYIAACVPDPATAAWQTGTGAALLIGQYFNSSDLSGSPAATRVDTELNFTSFNTTNVPVSNPSSFSAIWTGQVQPTITGDQVFKVASGGLVRLYVNNRLIIDNFSATGTPTLPISGKIAPQAGVTYSVRLEFKAIPSTIVCPGGLSGLRVSWASLQPPATLAGYNMRSFSLSGLTRITRVRATTGPFRFPEFQDELIQNAAKINPAIIVVLHGGGGFDVQAWVW